MESATNLDGARRPGVGMYAVRLISDRQEIRDLLGDRFDAELTYPKIFLDSVGNATPVIVDAGGNLTLVINVADSEAAAVARQKVRLQTYGHYFDWGQVAAPILSFSEAVRVAAGPGRLVVAPSLPVSRAEALGVNSLDVEPDHAETRVYISHKKRSEVERQWQSSREQDAAGMRPFISTLRRSADILDALSKPAVGYAALEALMHDVGLDAVFISSPFHSEMFTGLPRTVAERTGITCLFVRGQDDVVVFSRQPLGRSDFKQRGHAASVAEAIRAVVGGGATGIEEGHLGIGPWQSLRNAGCAVKNAAFVLRRWQDQRAGDDLPYYIAAANAVLRGFEKARDHIRQHLAGGMTESDARSAFDRGVAEFAAGIGLEGRIKPYFDIIHSGERTLLPATAGDYPLKVTDQTIKFDMGLLVHDTFGCVRACSDIARTLSCVPELQGIHDDLRMALVDRLIPAMRPGMTGAQVHAAGVDVLRSFIPRMHKAGLMPPGATAEGYLRDCGHTIHRTTAGTVYFLPDAKTTIESGMLGCVEFVWPFERKIIAVEDGYYVTDKEVIPFTV